MVVFSLFSLLVNYDEKKRLACIFEEVWSLWFESLQICFDYSYLALPYFFSNILFLIDWLFTYSIYYHNILYIPLKDFKVTAIIL